METRLGEGWPAHGTRVLTAESVRRTQILLVKTSYLGSMRGLVWSIYETQGVKRVGHQGATHGQQALLTLAPARGFALVVLTNSNRGASLAGRVATWALEHYMGVLPQEPVAPDGPAERLREYTSTYRGYGAGLDVEVSVGEDGRPWLHITERGGYVTADKPEHPRPPARAEPVAEDALRVAEGWDTGNVAEFPRDRGGTVQWLRYAGRVLVRS